MQKKATKASQTSSEKNNSINNLKLKKRKEKYFLL